MYQICLIITMFMPVAAVFLSGHSLKGLGWKPTFRNKIRYYFVAWFGPFVLGVLGAVLFFLIFPKSFDPDAGMLVQTIGEAGMKQLEAAGLSVPMYLFISCISAITYAPLVNMFPAIGEEIGWRGIMYPALKEKYGKTKGRITGGIIWGIWHWPMMLLAGYEYGKEYVGAPVLGLIVFCLFTIAGGILLDYLYEKTECIWVAAIGHGAINAFVIPLYFLHTDYIRYQIFGPSYAGFIGMIPMLIAAFLIEKKSAQ